VLKGSLPPPSNYSAMSENVSEIHGMKKSKAAIFEMFLFWGHGA